MKEPARLRRALLLSSALLFVLGLIAFWPSRRWTPPPRPALQAPIVFDELVERAAPPGEPSPPPQ